LLGRLLLTLCGGACRGGELGPEVFVFAQQAGQFRLDLIEERIDLVLVIALAETDGRELLVTHVLGGQRHFFTSA